ncbi:uncharacterized protein MONBRDRAFT_23700 [Monosiga brevicollis MX1]|uniref:C2H2-type domain-containing protein n=1 Tax=Monosiga brevicollis TaxID=81824 RepID=A9UU75_MONBE|nr:uncharacterized protein MONBRDRAFT_23700 [Monosiga brevicollis MX1]EDQ91373.1 predicted protein [Monosiga brevicollis MX1]|eukprot:XP_001743795.1 hypothetical protein [Monosiga brevicollis MX1]
MPPAALSGPVPSSTSHLSLPSLDSTGSGSSNDVHHAHKMNLVTDPVVMQQMAAEETITAMEAHVSCSMNLQRQADQHAAARQQAELIKNSALTQALNGNCTQNVVEEHQRADSEAQMHAQLEVAARQKAQAHAHAAQTLDSALEEQVIRLQTDPQTTILASAATTLPANVVPLPEAVDTLGASSNHAFRMPGLQPDANSNMDGLAMANPDTALSNVGDPSTPLGTLSHASTPSVNNAAVVDPHVHASAAMGSLANPASTASFDDLTALSETAPPPSVMGVGTGVGMGSPSFAASALPTTDATSAPIMSDLLPTINAGQSTEPLASSSAGKALDDMILSKPALSASSVASSASNSTTGHGRGPSATDSGVNLAGLAAVTTATGSTSLSHPSPNLVSLASSSLLPTFGSNVASSSSANMTSNSNMGFAGGMGLPTVTATQSTHIMDQADAAIAQAQAIADLNGMDQPLLNAGQTPLSSDALSILGNRMGSSVVTTNADLDSIMLQMHEEASVQSIAEALDGKIPSMPSIPAGTDVPGVRETLDRIMTRRAHAQLRLLSGSSGAAPPIPTATTTVGSGLLSSSGTTASTFAPADDFAKPLPFTGLRRSARMAAKGLPSKNPPPSSHVASKRAPSKGSGGHAGAGGQRRPSAGKRGHGASVHAVAGKRGPSSGSMVAGKRGPTASNRSGQANLPTSTATRSGSGEPAAKQSKSARRKARRSSKYPRECPAPGCDKIFSSSAGFYYHVRTVHNANKNAALDCPVRGCGKSFRSAPGLEYHLQKHKEGQITDDNGKLLLCDDTKIAKKTAMTRRRNGSLKATEACDLASNDQF